MDEQRPKDGGAYTDRPPHPEHIMQFFAYAHLPPHLQEVSKPFGEMAETIVATLPRNPERTVALRKLLEAKDAAVRALLAKDFEWDEFAQRWTQKGATGPAINPRTTGA
jgi:hypothetical protein